MGKTSIEWTDASWNPIVGCYEVSPGCANCYAARLAATRLRNTVDYKGLTKRVAYCDEHRLPLEDGHCPKCRDANGEPFVLDMQSIVLSHDSRWSGEVRFLPERLEEPLHWKKPRRIFVCDMGDLFHDAVAPLQIAQTFGVMALAQKHTFQVLTKRPARMLDFIKNSDAKQNVNQLFRLRGAWPTCDASFAWPLPNVWLGVSVENQHFANERIPLLLATPAAVRWISAEPLLGEINTGTWLVKWCAIRAKPSIDWVVCGGESGPNARPMHPEWARSLRDQCQAAGVPFFFKQWGEWLPIRLSQHDSPDPSTGYKVMNAEGRCWLAGAPQSQTTAPWLFQRLGKKAAGRRLDGREWNEFPAKAVRA